MSLNPEAKDLPCVFASLAEDYPGSKPVKCKTDEKQKWRHASSDAAVKRVTEAAKYFPELTSLLDSLEHYSLCERHYNQAVVRNSFINQLTETNTIFLGSGKTGRKRLIELSVVMEISLS
jgi:hypothetical protein